MRLSPQHPTPHFREAPPPLDVRGHALFLDLDGTLVEIQERPHAVTAGDELRDLLQRLSDRMNGAVALVTGRTVEDASRILKGSLQTVAGVHGFEMQQGGALFRDIAELSPITAASEDLRALIQEQTLTALIEDKRASLALHYRHAPETEAHVQQVAAEIAAKRGLRVLQGKMVVELVAGGRTKGDAVNAFMAEAPFAGRLPVVLGDDLTDEDAFIAADDVEGFGVLIGAPRETAAKYGLAGPAEVFNWLSAGIAS